MASALFVPLSEYLGTSYRPDCEYLEGELLQRNVGEWDHGRLQGLLTRYLVVLEQRVQVKANPFRVPDITVLKGSRPDTGIVTEPPFLCIEILSPRDWFEEMQDRIDDYLAFGVRYVRVIDPRTRHAFVHTPNSVQRIKDSVLTTEEPAIGVSLNELE